MENLIAKIMLAAFYSALIAWYLSALYQGVLDGNKLQVSVAGGVIAFLFFLALGGFKLQDGD